MKYTFEQKLETVRRFAEGLLPNYYDSCGNEKARERLRRQAAFWKLKYDRFGEEGLSYGKGKDRTADEKLAAILPFSKARSASTSRRKGLP